MGSRRSSIGSSNKKLFPGYNLALPSPPQSLTTELVVRYTLLLLSTNCDPIIHWHCITDAVPARSDTTHTCFPCLHRMDTNTACK